MVSNAFLPYRKSNAAIVGVNANLITTSPKHPPTLGASAYNCSKLAQAKLLEHLAAENPDLYVVSVHPGVVETDMLAEMTGGSDFTLDRSIMDDSKPHILAQNCHINDVRLMLTSMRSQITSTLFRLGSQLRGKVSERKVRMRKLGRGRV